MFHKIIFGLCALSAAAASQAGPFAPAAGKAGSTAISMSSADIAGWATGYLNYLPGSNASGTFQTPALALGAATGVSTDVVSLGDSGQITLTFAGAIYNGAGADFAVFENSFSDTFLELAWVEVSSDGEHFARFKGYSFTASAVGSYGSVDPTNIDGLAGKYRAGYGTPFDLSLLDGTPYLDVNNVRYVRLVDIRGDGSVLDDYPAAYGGPHKIYDPYPTTASGGFDLDAVAVMHLSALPAVPEPSTWLLLAVGAVAIGATQRRSARG